MTVVKRDTKSGTVYGVVNRVKDPATGVSRARWMGTYPTAEEAKIADGEALKQRREGTYTAPSRQTFGEYLRDWLAGLDAAVAGGSLKASTRGFYRDVVVTHLIPRLAGPPSPP